jgi:hypothetical protein
MPVSPLDDLRLETGREVRRQPSPSTIAINHRHQPSPSTIAINHRHQPSPSTEEVFSRV